MKMFNSALATIVFAVSAFTFSPQANAGILLLTDRSFFECYGCSPGSYSLISPGVGALVILGIFAPIGLILVFDNDGSALATYSGNLQKNYNIDREEADALAVSLMRASRATVRTGKDISINLSFVAPNFSRSAELNRFLFDLENQ